MGTKNNPGRFDCYTNAHPDEPMFILLGRDRQAAALVRWWANTREALGENPEMLAEARQCANAMEQWCISLGKTPITIAQKQEVTHHPQAGVLSALSRPSVSPAPDKALPEPLLSHDPEDVQEWINHMDLHLTEHDNRHAGLALRSAWPHVRAFLFGVMNERNTWKELVTNAESALTALRQRAEELAKQLADTTVLDSYADENQRLHDRALAAEALLAAERQKNEGLVRDAERYRYVRSPNRRDAVIMGNLYPKLGFELDAAIDAARSRQGAGE